MPPLPRAALLFSLASAAFVLALSSGACSSNDTTVAGDAAPGEDGAVIPKDGATIDEDGATSTDGAAKDGGGDGASTTDSGCPTPVTKPATGETCIGFGKKEPCSKAACGLPQYGYVCFNGGPPGFAGCQQVSASAFGETYCCPDNKCVPQPDQDAMCNAVSGKPKRYQCPPDGSGGHVTAPAGCVETGSGGSDLEKFYCCP